MSMHVSVVIGDKTTLSCPVLTCECRWKRLFSHLCELYSYISCALWADLDFVLGWRRRRTLRCWSLHARYHIPDALRAVCLVARLTACLTRLTTCLTNLWTACLTRLTAPLTHMTALWTARLAVHLTTRLTTRQTRLAGSTG